MGAASRVFKWVVIFGLIGFIPGFFGPIVFAPEANQGPLLGVFITGPIGAVVGLGVGLWREWRHRPGDEQPHPNTTTPPLPSAEEFLGHPLSRVIAGMLALMFLVAGIRGLSEGAGRGAGAAIVIALLAGWFAVTARFPEWVRRR